ncbi:uncharacterized protein LODBEIA_P23620 [Lodderomyces beijingensis]|uniref:DNA repair protein rad9 n=1 Tax=Lodderomyces beijingensis TaxID=1775926 RepID=A0ABP0ZJ22_9ASCO
MGLTAEIDDKKHYLIWSKSIAALSVISEAVYFTVTRDAISLSAINVSRTSHGEVVFRKSFFSKLEVDFKNVISDGYNGSNAKNEPSYSFLINSKHLTTVFRNLDSNGMKYIILQVNWRADAPRAAKYKLRIEIKNKKMIIKKYQTGYIPITRKEINIASAYKDDFCTQVGGKLNDRNRVSHIMIDLVIPRQFLEMVPTLAENFKIDIKNEKVSFGGYTKSVMKDRDYIKQPMAVTVTISLDELADSNLLPTGEGEGDDEQQQQQEPMRKTINFGMRDFRNFLNLVSFFTSSSATFFVEQFDDDVANLGNPNEYFHMYFREAGDPILFDFQSSQHVEVQFIQITAGDKTVMDGEEIEATKFKSKLALEAPTVHRIEPSEEEQAGANELEPHTGQEQDLNIGNNSRSASASPQSMRPFAFGRLRNDRSQNLPKATLASRLDSANDSMSNSDQRDEIITYDQNQHNNNLAGEDTEYSDSEEDISMPPLKRKLVEPEEYGPTQVDKAKSIF